MSDQENRGRSKTRPRIDLPGAANNAFQIDIATKIAGKARVEGGGRLPSCLANFVSFQGMLTPPLRIPAHTPFRPIAASIAARSCRSATGLDRIAQGWSM